MLRVYVAGNRLLEGDSLPLRIMPHLAEELPGVDFVEFDPTENFPAERRPVILDTVLGLREVRVLREVDDFVLAKPYSLHDFDLGLTLKLMLKAGLLDGFAVIGVPPSLSEDEAVRHVCVAVRSMRP